MASRLSLYQIPDITAESQVAVAVLISKGVAAKVKKGVKAKEITNSGAENTRHEKYA